MPSNKNRVSVGQGVNAFFREEEDTSTPVQKQASTEAQRQASASPASQDTSTPVNERDTSKPAQKQASKPLIKASYYISEDDDWKLEQIRISRRRRGVKVDKSALIREAIALLQE